MIYLDNAASTKVYDELKPILENYYFKEVYNPSAPFNAAFKLHNEIKEARERLAKLLHCNYDEVYFSSCATESNNTIIYGAVNNNKGNIICSAVEHSSVYNCFMDLKSKGEQVDICPINPKTGAVDEEAFRKLLNKDTKFVSIMLVNNETGVINDIKKLVKITREIAPKAKFHSDGVQGFCKIPVNLKDLDVDFFTFSGHKFYAPKGIGGMFIKCGVHIEPLLHGGGQEIGMRSGTENVPGIMCMAKAAEITCVNMERNLKKYEELSQYMISEIKSNVDCVINRFENNAPYILNIAFKGIRGEVLVHALESKEIYINTASACSSKKGTSRVGFALSVPREYEEGFIRISFGTYNTMEEIKIATAEIIKEVKALYKAQN